MAGCSNPDINESPCGLFTPMFLSVKNFIQRNTSELRNSVGIA